MLNTTGRIAIAGLAACSLILVGCGSKETNDTKAATTSSAAATSTAAAAAFPVTVDNCGMAVTMDKAPDAVVTMNQGATELVLALGAADQMVGTAYLDDEIDPAVAAEYAKIPVLSDKYPSQEALLNVKPDFVVASYSSAFKPEAAGSREELESLGINSYLDPFACADKSFVAPVKWDSIYGEITGVGELLGRSDNADALVDTTKATVADLEKSKAGEGKTVFWYDSGTDEPLVGAGHGGPQLILNTVGATNIFADVDGGWGKGSWESVLVANPDYIVVADASWDTADAKIEYLKTNPSTKDLDAVKNEHFIVVPFAETSPGVHLVDGAEKVAKGLAS